MTDPTSNQPLSESVQRVLDAVQGVGLDITLQEFPQGTRTADDAAAAVGCEVDQIVKSMIFDADGELVLALTSGANQVDPEKLAAAVGAEQCVRASADRVRATTGFAIGGVSPFGHLNPIRSWLDPHLLTFDDVWVAAGSPRHVFGLPSAVLAELTGAPPVDFCVS